MAKSMIFKNPVMFKMRKKGKSIDIQKIYYFFIHASEMIVNKIDIKEDLKITIKI